MDSLLWMRWFVAENDARQQSVEAHLEVLKDDYTDYEAQQTHTQPETAMEAAISSVRPHPGHLGHLSCRARSITSMWR